MLHDRELVIAMLHVAACRERACQQANVSLEGVFLSNPAYTTCALEVLASCWDGTFQFYDEAYRAERARRDQILFGDAGGEAADEDD